MRHVVLGTDSRAQSPADNPSLVPDHGTDEGCGDDHTVIRSPAVFELIAPDAPVGGGSYGVAVMDITFKSVEPDSIPVPALHP